MKNASPVLPPTMKYVSFCPASTSTPCTGAPTVVSAGEFSLTERDVAGMVGASLTSMREMVMVASVSSSPSLTAAMSEYTLVPDS